MAAPISHARPDVVVTPAFEPSLRVRGLRFPGNGILRPETGRSKTARRAPLVSWETEPASQSPPDVGQFADREEMSVGSGMIGGAGSLPRTRLSFQNSLITGNQQGIPPVLMPAGPNRLRILPSDQWVAPQFPAPGNREVPLTYQGLFSANQGNKVGVQGCTLVLGSTNAICSRSLFSDEESEMAVDQWAWRRQYDRSCGPYEGRPTPKASHQRRVTRRRRREAHSCRSCRSRSACLRR